MDALPAEDSKRIAIGQVLNRVGWTAENEWGAQPTSVPSEQIAVLRWHRTALVVTSDSGTDLSVDYVPDGLHRLRSMQDLRVLNNEVVIDEALLLDYFGYRRQAKQLNVVSGTPLTTQRYDCDAKGGLQAIDWRDAISFVNGLLGYTSVENAAKAKRNCIPGEPFADLLARPNEIGSACWGLGMATRISTVKP